jgi:hypothetical protein
VIARVIKDPVFYLLWVAPLFDIAPRHDGYLSAGITVYILIVGSWVSDQLRAPAVVPPWKESW